MTKVDSLQKFVDLIRERPAMYIGGRSIHQLKAFIDGWFFGSSDEISDDMLLSEFQDWLVAKYQVKGSQSWAQIILFYSMDEYSALENFFRLFSDYLKEKDHSSLPDS